MKIIKIEGNNAEINLSMGEIFALRQVFYMLYFHNSKIDNPKQKIGLDEREIKESMDYFEDLGNRINPDGSVVKSINKKACNLRTQEYDLCLYMVKMSSSIEDLKYLVALQKKGTGKAILKASGGTISIKQIRQDLILLKEQANSLDDETDTVSLNMFNEAVELNISKSKLEESDLVKEPQLNIKFVFPRGIQFSYADSDKSTETRKEIPFDSPKSFSSTLTLENITNFITKVEDFFDNKVNNNHN